MCDRCHRKTHAEEGPAVCAAGRMPMAASWLRWRERHGLGEQSACAPGNWLSGGRPGCEGENSVSRALGTGQEWPQGCLELGPLSRMFVAVCGPVTAAGNWMHGYIVLEGTLSLDPEDMDLSFCFAPKQQPGFGTVSDHWVHSALTQRRMVLGSHLTGGWAGPLPVPALTMSMRFRWQWFMQIYTTCHKSLPFFNDDKEIHIIFKTVIKITVLFASINLISPFMNNKKRYRLWINSSLHHFISRGKQTCKKMIVIKETDTKHSQNCANPH